MMNLSRKSEVIRKEVDDCCRL